MYMQRSMGYIGIINAIMIIFLTISKLEDYGIEINMKYLMLPIIITLIVFLIFIGWLEDKLGLFRSEAYHTVQRNPYITEILSRVQSIESKLDGKQIEDKILKDNLDKNEKSGSVFK